MKTFLAILLLLSGCGFEPVYKTSEDAKNTLSQVAVKDVPGRAGQIFTASLKDRLNPTAQVSNPRFLLQPTVDIQIVPISIDDDGTIARFRLLFDTSYTLKDMKTEKIIQRDRIRRSSSYNISDADYSTFIAERNAIEEGAETLAHEYFLRIAAFLKQYQQQQNSISPPGKQVVALP
jgi:LPS-assembly lipoprotein